jgi:hypothetical protein
VGTRRALSRGMKTFECVCGNRLFFDNSRCLSCSREVAFSMAENTFHPLGEGVLHCQNYGKGLCNWLVDDQSPDGLCLACRLNIGSTDVEQEGGSELIANAEKAKRRLVYSLINFGLPVVPKSSSELGVGFTIRSGTPESPVITGHSDGLITLDLNEADPAKREATRKSLGENYRTLLGHFRHESGHYYFQLMFEGEEAEKSGRLKEFRDLFGDESVDYAEALKAHYASPNKQFEEEFVSSYASSHPWEDWAETWAHYFHIRDSWETAVSFGLRTPPPAHDEAKGGFDAFLTRWAELVIALNAMNRSMGHADAYPFHFSEKVRTKLGFVHRAVTENADRLRDRLLADVATRAKADKNKRPTPVTKPSAVFKPNQAPAQSAKV